MPETSKQYNCLIIGAGPGGLTAAEILAQSGQKVLVLEKGDKISRKVCAEGLTAKDLEWVPKKVIQRSFKKVKIIIGKKAAFITDRKNIVFTCSRAELKKCLWEKAEKAGAKIIPQSNVMRISKTFAITSAGKKYYYQHLIGADGSTSIVRKFLKLSTRAMGFGMQYITKKRFKDLSIFINSKRFGPFYAWIFPNDTYSTVGTGGVSQKNNIKDLRQGLDELLKELCIDKNQCQFEAGFINSDYQGHDFGNIHLIGDAAGLAYPLTGEGIYQAVISGQDVAQKILDQTYRQTGIKKIVGQQKKQRQVTDKYRSHEAWLAFSERLIPILLKSRKFQNKVIRNLAY